MSIKQKIIYILITITVFISVLSIKYTGYLSKVQVDEFFPPFDEMFSIGLIIVAIIVQSILTEKEGVSLLDLKPVFLGTNFIFAGIFLYIMKNTIGLSAIVYATLYFIEYTLYMVLISSRFKTVVFEVNSFKRNILGKNDFSILKNFEQEQVLSKENKAVNMDTSKNLQKKKITLVVMSIITIILGNIFYKLFNPMIINIGVRIFLIIALYKVYVRFRKEKDYGILNMKISAVLGALLVGLAFGIALDKMGIDIDFVGIFPVWFIAYALTIDSKYKDILFKIEKN